MHANYFERSLGPDEERGSAAGSQQHYWIHTGNSTARVMVPTNPIGTLIILLQVNGLG